MNTVFSAVLLSCLAAVSLGAAAGDGPSSCPVKGGSGKYSYDPTSSTGPAMWGYMEGYEACKDGQIQSPIDFPTECIYKSKLEGPDPNMTGGVMDFSAGVQNWALSCAEGVDCGYTMFGGKKYNVINYHIHAPSEHTLNGKQYPMESHIVHQAEDGSLGVIATMFQYPENDTYPAIVYEKANVAWGTSSLTKNLIKNIGADKESFRVPLGSIINANKGYCTYTGSLTTPPCSEGVTFMMSMNIPYVTKRQVHDYAVSAGASYDGNNRPLNPINNREITCYIL